MPKPINLSLTFRVPKGNKLKNASITPEGELVLKDDEGNTVVPEHMERTISYPREKKGPKIQSRSTASNNYLSVNGLKELTQYDSIFAIDTNTRIINEERVSVTCFVCCKFKGEGEKIQIECDGKLNIYEFRNIPEQENPKKLALLKVAQDIARSTDWHKNLKFAFITDSDIESHNKIGNREYPIYKHYFLPEGFTLHYASTDTGSEAIHKLIRFCDKQASHYFKCLNENAVKKSDLKQLEEDTSVQYRYVFRSDLELVNPVVKGITLEPGTKVSLYGIKE